MRIDILTVVPELLESPFRHSIIKRAMDKGLVEIYFHNIRDFSEDKHRKTDDYAFSGGAGMVMTIQPIESAINFLKSQRDYDEVIYTSPDGTILTQKIANKLSLLNNIIILCGHYKGIDERIREQYVTREISIGDYVLTGGELPALALIDAVSRFIPGVLGNENAHLDETFENGLLEGPQYTRPAEFKGMAVPEVLLSGHHANIVAWRHEQSLEKTRTTRPDLLDLKS